MTTKHELTAQRIANKWLQALPPDVLINTHATQVLKEHWLTNNPRLLAATFVDCTRQRVWEQIAYMPSVESKREVRSYSPLEWIRECIGAEPDELMRTVAGHLPNADLGTKAAINLIELMAAEDPATLQELCVDYNHGESNMLGWNGLFGLLQEVDPVWGKAQTKLQTALKSKSSEAPPNSTNGSRPSGGVKNPTLGIHCKAQDRKSRLIRTLTSLKDDPKACISKGTTPQKVSTALTRLVRGITPSAEAAKREAGLASSQKVNGGLGVRGESRDVARRLVALVGANRAKRIANAVLKQVGT